MGSFLCAFLLNTTLGTLANINQEPIIKEALDVTYGELFYPLAMFIIGGSYIRRQYTWLRKQLASVEANLKQEVAVLEGDGEVIAKKTQEIWENRKVKVLHQHKIAVLAFQTCMALAFEEFFDNVLRNMESNHSQRAFKVAAVVTAVWASTWVWSFRHC